MEDWEAVADRHGLIRTADALRIGLTGRQLARLVRDGDLVRLGRGWYSLPLVPASDEDNSAWARRRTLHAAQATAAVVAYEGRAVASHHSALVLSGVPAFSADLRQVHLTRVADTWSRRRRGLTLHQMVPGAVATDGVIDLAVAVVQAGCLNGSMAALVAADAALHRGLLDNDHLRRGCDLVVGPRSSVVRAMLRHADGSAESPGETRLRHALRVMGFSVAPQVPIIDGSFMAVVDFLVDGCVGVEFDGFVKYGRRRAFATEATPAEIVFAEKVREDHVRELGHEMVRVVWADFEELPLLRRRVERALSLAANRGLTSVRAGS
jgi:hypothetical protein